MGKGSVSVVIPAYNAEWCVERAIESVLTQTRPPREIIVVNDGSTDTTGTIVQQYADPIRLVEQPNRGLSNARNTGIRLAKGKWIAFLDADDYWLRHKLERQMTLLESEPKLGFCSTSARVETPSGEKLNIWQCPKQTESTLHTIFNQNSAIAGSGSAVIARRDLLIESGLFDESLRSLEDIDMWLRLAAITRYGCVEEALTVILKRPDSMSRNLDVMRQSALTVMQKNRRLLEQELRGGFWRAAYVTVLADYAKWEYRIGRKWSAIVHLLEGFGRAPFRRGRLLLSLLAAMVLGQRI